MSSIPNYLGTLFVQPNTVTTTAPGASNDVSQGYQVASRWLNTTTGNEYVCASNALGAAVWNLTTASSASNTQAANTINAGPTTGSAAVPAYRALVIADLPTPASQAANLVFAGPASGSAATPTYRALVAADVRVDALQTVIADPGASGAIPVTATGTVLLTTAGAETRTIAAPTAVGIELLINFETKVGNCVITVVSTINATGNNTITFTTVGWSIRLVSVRTSTSAFRWAVVYTDGATLTTV